MSLHYHALRTLTLAIGLTLGAASLAAAEDVVRIGVIAPLTGGGAPWGTATAEGAKILAARVNAAGGLKVAGKQYNVQVIPYDDQYKSSDAVAAYNRLLTRDGAKFVLIMSSSAAVALKQNVEDDKIVGLTLAAAPKAAGSGTKFMFRGYSPPPDYLPLLVDWLKKNIDGRRIALINPNDEVGWDFSRLQERLMKEAGFEVVANELHERAAKDFQGLSTKIIALKPDVIDLGGVAPATAGLMVRQIRELGYKGQIVKTGGPSPKEIVDSAGKDAAEGMVMLLYADPQNRGYQDIAAEYKKSVGQEPNQLLVLAYDSTNVLLHAIEASGTVDDTSKIAAAFGKALPMTSVQGETLRLGNDQQILTVSYVGVVRNGELVVSAKLK